MYDLIFFVELIKTSHWHLNTRRHKCEFCGQSKEKERKRKKEMCIYEMKLMCAEARAI